ncbi:MULTISPECIES: alkaline phosphatase family protein [Halococcus]|uniref:Type I phosphodiesterase/nucleotide pyrophosphatase n=1 Tax=Halococcus salifodinae DSM 8989 TaxID=1227456 RepID=M0MXF6_9EURY|nr:MULTISPECIES: alkaline phosphatase family protein [Halococcus]EMA50422.1 type I phosphodiesterase/nucleotide pyrophosphatase [Halococcus salifodinae DSM 8989]
MPSRGSGPDTLLVGLDAACEPVLDRLFDAGADLPHLRAILDDGASGPLESQVPPWTASAWPSLYTGTNPGKHGVFGFLDFDGYDWDVVNATDVRERALWELLDSQGLSSVVVNVPVTHPPREFDGALVPGYVAPDDPACHPAGLLREVREAIGEYRVYPRHTGGSETTTTEKVAEYRDTIEMRGDAFRYLEDRFAPDFGFVEFQATDTVFHECPGDFDAVRAVYEAVDEQIGAILDACDPGTVVVASDHGIGEYTGYDVRLNTLLRDAGFTETARGGRGMPSWDVIRDEQFLDDGSGDEGDERDSDSSAGGPNDSETNLLERAMETAARAGVTSQRVGRVLERLGLAEVVVRHVPKGMIRAGTEQVDFPASQAYARSHIECGIRLNVAGREPDGVVPREEYDAVREAIIDLLSDLETPDGKPAFDDVARREAYFEGGEAERAVDVVVVPRAFDQFLSTQLRETAFGPPTEPYNHKRDGLIAATGEGIDDGASLAGAHLFDVAPTVLATLGLARGEHMDGDVLALVESMGERAYPELDERDREATDERAVEQRLSDLGYL